MSAKPKKAHELPPLVEVIVLADHQYGDKIKPEKALEVPGKDFIRSLNDTLMLGPDGQHYRLALAVVPADEEYVSRLDKEGICTHTREHTCHHCLEE